MHTTHTNTALRTHPRTRTHTHTHTQYRVPQSLLYLGVLRYEDNLMTQLKEGIHVEAGSEQESEIRGCSIWAVEVY